MLLLDTLTVPGAAEKMPCGESAGTRHAYSPDAAVVPVEVVERMIQDAGCERLGDCARERRPIVCSDARQRPPVVQESHRRYSLAIDRQILRFPELDPPYDEALRQAVDYLDGRYDIEALIACGTIIRGAPDPRSDLDVYVVSPRTC